jgi:thiol-disulfide isomerase/thioredoxin
MQPHHIKFLIVSLVIGLIIAGIFIYFKTKDTTPEKTQLHLKGSKLCVIKADQCTHCQKLRPVIKELTALPNMEDKIVVIDGPSHKDLLKKWKIIGYPTIGILNPEAKSFTKLNIRRDKDTLLSLLNQL